VGQLISKLAKIRAFEPERINQALKDRPRPRLKEVLQGKDGRPGKLMVIACDHPARGALGAGSDLAAMADREELLSRCCEALARPGVNGFLGTSDMIEDLTLLGALDNKIVFGSMNRAGLAGATFGMDDRFNCYDAQGIEQAGLAGGKMLTRINYADAGTVATLQASARAIDELAERKLMAMVEPFISVGSAENVRNVLTADAVIKSITIASGLGRTSAYTWLKLPCVAEMERVMEATTLPSLILGGEVSNNPDAALQSWGNALRLPNVLGLVIGRSLLFPVGDDVAQAVDETVGLL